MDCSLPGLSVNGILQARILEWVAIPFSKGPSRPRGRTWVSCIAVRFFYRLSHQGSPYTCLPIFIFNDLQHSGQSVQSLSHVRLFATPWIAARQASLSITNSWSSPKLICIKSLMASSHLILCRPLLLLPPIPPSIRVFSNESTLRMR